MRGYGIVLLQLQVAVCIFLRLNQVGFCSIQVSNGLVIIGGVLLLIYRIKLLPFLHIIAVFKKYTGNITAYLAVNFHFIKCADGSGIFIIVNSRALFYSINIYRYGRRWLLSLVFFLSAGNCQQNGAYYYCCYILRLHHIQLYIVNRRFAA